MRLEDEPLAWISDESINRLAEGGNGSRGTVPVHPNCSSVSRIGLYTENQVVQRVSALQEEVRREYKRAEHHKAAHQSIRGRATTKHGMDMEAALSKANKRLGLAVEALQKVSQRGWEIEAYYELNRSELQVLLKIVDETLAQIERTK